MDDETKKKKRKKHGSKRGSGDDDAQLLNISRRIQLIDVIKLVREVGKNCVRQGCR